MVKIFAIIFIAHFFVLGAFSQKQKISLPIQKIDGLGPFESGFFPIVWNTEQTTVPWLCSNCYPAVKAPKEITRFKIGMILADPIQFIHQTYISGKLSTASYKTFTAGLNKKIDTTKISDRPLKCYVLIGTWKNKAGKTEYVIDSDNDHDLSDEKPIHIAPSTVSQVQLRPYIHHIPVERKNNGGIEIDTVSILLGTPGEWVGYMFAEVIETDTLLNGVRLKIRANSNSFSSASYRTTEIAITKNSGQPQFLGDSAYFNLNGNWYQYLGVDISSKRINIIPVQKAVLVSPQTNFYAPPFSDINIQDNKRVSNEDYIGKYLFIAFWGTWCAPCLAEMPKIKRAYKSLKSQNVEMISIAAFDTPAAIKKFVLKNGIYWPQLVSNQIKDLYHIKSFPTNFLIDPSGRIIARDLETKDLFKSIMAIVKKE